MFIVKYSYNSLTKLGRRIIAYMAGFQITVAMMAIPLGFGFLVYAADNPGSSIRALLGWLGAGVLVAGFSLWGRAYNNAKLEQKEKSKSDQKLSEALEQLNETLKNINNKKDGN